MSNGRKNHFETNSVTTKQAFQDTQHVTCKEEAG
jgi:hypothetical protein